MTFTLHPALKEKDYVCDLGLCQVLFEDNRDYPWIFLVPKKENVKSMLDLTLDERMELMCEMEVAEKAMAKLFGPDQTNVAMIGNMTPQLHVHIICRYKNDPAWPGTVWGLKAKPYDPAVKQEMISKIRQTLIGEK